MGSVRERNGGDGLSPRVRGNPIAQAGWPPGCGSIPACAGEPSSSPPAPRTPTVYPRVCGGTPGGAVPALPQPGLSPRVRGNRQRRLRLAECLRSIPACAGEPRRFAGWCEAREVYPRVCGGTAEADRLAEAARGLSPRVRGNRRWPNASGLSIGSIPACAGEPHGQPDNAGPTGVYPRVCGGTDRTEARSSIRGGLSPRVRGNRRTRFRLSSRIRSIPACAGEPLPRPCRPPA